MLQAFNGFSSNRKSSYQLWGRPLVGGPECSRNQAGCRGGWRPGRSAPPHRTPTAPSALPPDPKQTSFSAQWVGGDDREIQRVTAATFCRSWSFRVLVQSNWNTMCPAKVCLMQRTTYSVSASVSCTGSDDLKSGPRPWNSGMAASCSTGEKYAACQVVDGESSIVFQDFKIMSCTDLGKCLGVKGPVSLATCLWRSAQSLSKQNLVSSLSSVRVELREHEAERLYRFSGL